jgi:hypothetical protein
MVDVPVGRFPAPRGNAYYLTILISYAECAACGTSSDDFARMQVLRARSAPQGGGPSSGSALALPTQEMGKYPFLWNKGNIRNNGEESIACDVPLVCRLLPACPPAAVRALQSVVTVFQTVTDASDESSAINRRLRREIEISVNWAVVLVPRTAVARITRKDPIARVSRKGRLRPPLEPWRPGC